MTVVNIKYAKCTHYCGRQNTFRQQLQSPLHNPYHISRQCSREESIRLYEIHVRARPDLLEMIRNLPANAVLGCYCKPLACHCDVIVKIWKEFHEPVAA